MAFLVGGANSAADTAYNIDNSCRFDGASDDLLRYTPDATSSDANKRKYTISLWFKRSELVREQGLFNWGKHTNSDDMTIFFQADSVTEEYLRIYDYGNDFGGDANYNWTRYTSREFRDLAAWYHLVVRVDTTDSTAGDRVKVYINGVQETSFRTSADPDQNYAGFCGSGDTCDIGRNVGNTDRHFGGYVADVAYVDGTAYDASYFGETDEDSGIWKPKTPNVTWGGNGFFLEFQASGTGTNASGIGADTSGNTNHFAVTNLTAVDQTTDTPTNNFCTMNLLDAYETAMAEGNTHITQSGSYQICTATIAIPNSGKWYCEVEIDALDSADDDHFYTGLIDRTLEIESAAYDAHARTIQWNHTAAESSVGKFVDEGTATYSNSAIRLSAGDIIMIAVDRDNNKLWFGKAGTWYDDDGSTDGDPAGNSNETATLTATREYVFFCGGGGEEFGWKWNFGNPPFAISSTQADDNGYGNFEYDVPAGFYALCTKNLAEFGG